MKMCFLTECGYVGKYPRNFTNCRTDIAWQIALDAEHIPLNLFSEVKGFDYVVIIWPKGECIVNRIGAVISERKDRRLSMLLKSNVIETLKKNNTKVCYMQEGPANLFMDYELEDQIGYYNAIEESDIILVHNSWDVQWYAGLFPNKKVFIMPSLIIEDSIKDIVPIAEDKTMIGGNFAYWYSGFASYIMAQNFNNPIYVPSMHCKRVGEDQLENLTHLPYMQWNEWMKTLSTFKYAVHLMPTVAAGTLSLNSALFGIPCIGNHKLDTQRGCFPRLSFDVEDLNHIANVCQELKNNKDFYMSVSYEAKDNYHKYFSEEAFLNNMKPVFA